MAQATIISPNGTTSTPAAAPTKAKKERKAKVLNRVYRVVEESKDVFKIHVMVKGQIVATMKAQGQGALEMILWDQFMEANGQPVTVEVKTLS